MSSETAGLNCPAYFSVAMFLDFLDFRFLPDELETIIRETHFQISSQSFVLRRRRPWPDNFYYMCCSSTYSCL